MKTLTKIELTLIAITPLVVGFGGFTIAQIVLGSW